MKIINGMEFVDDTLVVGKWKLFDNIASMSDFDGINKFGTGAGAGFNEIYFLPQGKGYWIFEAWTKGVMVLHYGGDEPLLEYKYEIRETNDKLFLFVFVKNEDEEYVCVLEKVSSKEYTIADVARRENIEREFVIDEKVVGEWKSVFFAETLDDFSGKEESSDRLWLERIEFLSDGRVLRHYMDETWTDKWTKGELLDQKKSVASKYFFKTFSNQEYLFLEWKMGNYVYGGKPANYYIFVKEKEKE